VIRPTGVTNIMGGYTSLSWTSAGVELQLGGEKAWLFSLVNSTGRSMKFAHVSGRAVCSHGSYGPLFGEDDLSLCGSGFPGICRPKSFKGGPDASQLSAALLCGTASDRFKVDEVEVFAVDLTAH